MSPYYGWCPPPNRGRGTNDKKDNNGFSLSSMLMSVAMVVAFVALLFYIT